MEKEKKKALNGVDKMVQNVFTSVDFIGHH